MTALLVLTAALLLLPIYVVALAVVRLLDRTDATVHVRPASDAAIPSTVQRTRTKTLASPRAKAAPLPEDTWNGTTPTPDSGVAAPQRRSGDS